MKTLIVALNSKYIHSALAPWYLKAFCTENQGEVKVIEFTINEHLDSVLSVISPERADVVAFSCYIWNIENVLKISENIKKVSPHVKIVLGGPEVSFEVERFMQHNLSIDYIIMGEGEASFKALIGHLKCGDDNLENVKGIAYRKNNEIIVNEMCEQICELDCLPSPYTDEMLKSIGDRILYFESSRGCPFSCSYCLSSTTKGVRNFSLERVKDDMNKIMKTGVRQIKFVDRTFNCNKPRAKEILRYIIECNDLNGSNTGTNFHFEVAADLFDDEMIDILSGAPSGLIQLEVGIQSTNTATLELVDRKTDLDKAFSNIIKLRSKGNINIHLDLIAGLPEEDYNSFRNSFNQAYLLNAHQLQLGFLKMLKGSKIRDEADLHQYCYRDYPPYEVLYNKYITFEEILEFKEIEELVDKYYNSGRFQYSLKYIIEKYFETPYEFYKSFLIYSKNRGLIGRSLPSRDLYSALIEYCRRFETCEIINELMKLDYLASDNSRNIPQGIIKTSERAFKDRCFDFLKDSINIAEYMPQYQGVSAKEIFKRVHFEIFMIDVTQTQETGNSRKEKTVVMFDYSVKNRVTGLYKFWKVSL